MTGIVLNIQHFSVHHGPGIRTVIYVKGCPLRCRWCHQPEAQRREVELSFKPDRCVGCGYCFVHCLHGAHRRQKQQHILDRDACHVCGMCAEGCVAEGLTLIGRKVGPGELLAELERDRPFTTPNSGGLTLAGGEPLMQLDFSEALLRAATEAGFHSCLETSGFGAYAKLERLRPVTDLFLFDLRAVDNSLHMEYTGVSNRSILDNLQRLHDAQAPVRLRLMMVPGLNDTPAHFGAIRNLCQNLPGLEGIEIVPCGSAASRTAEQLGHQELDQPFELMRPTPENVVEWHQLATAAGLHVMASSIL